MGIRAGCAATAAVAVILAWPPAGAARAANDACAVDAADIGEPGSCKLEVHGNLAVDRRSLWAGGPIGYAKRDPAAVSDRREVPPNEIFSVDLIYGCNISGENAKLDHARHHDPFPGARRQADHHRTGHL
jgi:hypothetical protein